MPTIADHLRAAALRLADSETPQLDVRVLMKHVLGVDDAGLIARAGDIPPADAAARFAALVERRASDEPIAYIIGEKEFWSLRFRVTPDVLIPRNDSECLIEAALRRRARSEPLRILDLGTGSGCLLCALMHEFPESRGIGVDASAAAIEVARANAVALGFAGRAEMIRSDWFGAVSGRFDVIVANPPYVPDAAVLGRTVAGYEPAGALYGGADGLDAYRRIVENLNDFLAPDGLALFECGMDQVEALCALIRPPGSPATDPFTLTDLAGRPRGAGVDRRQGEKNG